MFDNPIHKARVLLFQAGGLTLVTDSKRGWMVADYPAAEPRADLYNELAELHKTRVTLPKALRARLEEVLRG